MMMRIRRSWITKQKNGYNPLSVRNLLISVDEYLNLTSKSATTKRKRKKKRKRKRKRRKKKNPRRREAHHRQQKKFVSFCRIMRRVTMEMIRSISPDLLQLVMNIQYIMHLLLLLHHRSPQP